MKLKRIEAANRRWSVSARKPKRLAKPLRRCAPSPLRPIAPSYPLFTWRLREAFLALTLSLFSFSAAFAISDNAGTSNGAFLKIPTDARGVVLGPTMAALAQGTEGMRWNPAALGSLENKEFMSTHIQYFQGVQIENAAFAYPLEDSALAASAFYLSPGTLDGRDLLGNPTGDFKFYDMVGSIGYGRRIMSRRDGADVYVGGAVKVVQEVIADSQFQNPALDAGILVVPFDEFQAGLSVRNLSTSKANFPKDASASAAYTFRRMFTGAVGLRYSDDAPVRVAVSSEYRIPELDAVMRVGYQNHDAIQDSVDSDISALRSASLAGLSMGAGFEYKPPVLQSLRLQLDYAMAPFGALGISHYITLKAKW